MRMGHAPAAASGKTDAALAQTNRNSAKAGADRSNHAFDDFLRPGRGRRALRRAASLFLRLLTRPPLRPFARLARCLASLRTDPPSRPSATACGFFRRRFFTDAFHTSVSSSAQDQSPEQDISYAKRLALLNQ
jgi:hypothetical protein